MGIVWSSYPSERLRSRAVTVLNEAGIANPAIRLLSGAHTRDRRTMLRGNFFGELAPDAGVGTFAGQARARSQAEGGYTGSRDDKRQGTFADTDRDAVLDPDADRPDHTLGDDELRDMLVRTGLPESDVAQIIIDVHHDREVVIAEVPDESISEVRERLASGVP